MGLRVVLIGGSGFIGARLARRLVNAGADVVIADLQRSADFPDRWQFADVTQPASLIPCLQGAELAINLAAAHGDDVEPPSAYETVNVAGALNLCSAADQCGLRRLIYVSSVAVYGTADRELDETAEPAPDSPYGRSKLAAEAIYRNWQGRSSDRDLVIVRPATVFGEGNRANIYRLMRSVARGSFRMFGDGHNRKSIAYVENVAAFLQFVAEHATGQLILNYADKPDPTMNELVIAVRTALGRPPTAGRHWPFWLGAVLARSNEVLCALFGRRPGITVARLRKFTAPTQFAAVRAGQAGFRPEIPLAEGLRRTVLHEFGGNAA